MIEPQVFIMILLVVLLKRKKNFEWHFLFIL